MSTPPYNVTVTLIRRPRPRLALRRRHQPWRWVARAANGRVLATSGESYVNKADALSGIWRIFGPATSVALQTEDGEYTLRSGEDDE